MGRKSREKRERRMAKPKRFECMDTPDATAKCGRPYDRNASVRTVCAVCDMSVFLHCGDCQIQITGCLCTAIERMDEREYAEFKKMVQEKKAREAGLIIPGSFN